MLQSDYDLFISHSSKDKDFVRDLHYRFSRVGIRCFLDERDIGAGGNIVAEVAQGIRSSRRVLLVYSPDFFSSDWAQSEYGRLLMKDPRNRDGKLIPLMYRDTTVPDELAEFKWLGAQSPIELEKAVRKILEAVLESAPVERVYISYTWDSEPHKDWVASLHRRLVRDGVDAKFDKDFMRPGRNYWKDIERYIERSTSALLIGTPRYPFNATSPEHALSREYAMLLAKADQDPAFRLIPVLRYGSWSGSFPGPLSENFGIDMSNYEREEAGYPLLLQTLLSPEKL